MDALGTRRRHGPGADRARRTKPGPRVRPGPAAARIDPGDRGELRIGGLGARLLGAHDRDQAARRNRPLADPVLHTLAVLRPGRVAARTLRWLVSSVAR